MHTWDNPYNSTERAREYERREAEREKRRQAHNRFVGPSNEALARIRAAAACQQCYDTGYVATWELRTHPSGSRYCTCAAGARERALNAAFEEA